MLGDVLETSQGAKDNLSWPPGPHMLLGMVWGREKGKVNMEEKEKADTRTSRIPANGNLAGRGG